MKKLNFAVILFTMALAVVVNSCDNLTSEPVGPTLQFFGGDFIDGDVTVNPGDLLAFSFLATKGDGNLASMDIQVDGLHLDGYPTEDIDKDNYKDTVYHEAPAIEGIYEYLFIVTDKKDLSDSVSFMVNVESPYNPIDTWENIQLFVPGSSGNTETNCASVDGTVFSYSDGKDNASLQQKADFVYYYVSSANIAAPSEVPSNINGGYSEWSTLNQTMFYSVDVTTSQFDAMTDDELIMEKVTGTSTNVAEDLAVGDVVGFKTSAGKMGMFKVTDLQAGYDIGDYIKITIKVQQTAK